MYVGACVRACLYVMFACARVRAGMSRHSLFGAPAFLAVRVAVREAYSMLVLHNESGVSKRRLYSYPLGVRVPVF